MTDIAKLKQEAEEARKRAAELIMYAQMPIADVSTHSKVVQIVDALTLAAAKQIALQAAEKEAEAQKHRVDVANATMQFGLACKKEPRLEKAFIDAMLSVREKFGTDPAHIADDGWIKWEGGECPIPGIENWEWKGRDGRISKEVKYLAEKLRWRHCDSCSDIIAYRIISPAADRVGEP